MNPIGLTTAPVRDYSHYDDFSSPFLPDHFQWFRIPNPNGLYSLTQKPYVLPCMESNRLEVRLSKRLLLEGNSIYPLWRKQSSLLTQAVFSNKRD